MVEDTIAAVATPLGQGGLGVVRVSGPNALSVAGALFACAPPLADASSHTLRHGHVMDGKRVVDDAVAAVFRAPRSYTGEDVVEISCHGGPFIVRRVLDLCLAAGARAAGPGEFTRRAFLNGKMDLAQAEAVAALISAQSEDYRRLALEQREGRLSRRIGDLRDRLLALLAHLEAGLDFAEEEVPDLSRAELSRRIGALDGELRALLETAPRGRLLRDGLRAVLVGRPNAGKSSLFNALLGGDRAIVTDVPGTTRDTLEERLVIDGMPVILTDTAGLRDSADRVEREGVSRARAALERADVALLVLDAAQPPSEEDRALAAALEGKRTILVLNKCDIAPAEAPAPGHLSNGPPVRVSALTGRGLEELRGALLKIAGNDGPSRDAASAPTIITARHEALLRDAARALDAAGKQASSGGPEECVAVDLRQALDRLGEITGQAASEELLDAVFSQFCIGK